MMATPTAVVMPGPRLLRQVALLGEAEVRSVVPVTARSAL